MNADRVYVLHRADGNDVALGIAHGFKLDLFPAGDAALYQDLGDGGGVQTGPGNDAHFSFIGSDAAAAPAQGIGGAHDDGIADIIGSLQGVLQGLGDLGRHAGLVDGQHGIPELLPVFRLLDGLDGGAQQADAEFLQRAVAAQLHGQGQAGLAAKAGNHAVRAFFFDDPADGGGIQRLEVDLVRQVLVRHNGSRIGVDQHHVDAFRFQYAAGLGTGIVKLGCLADDDGAGADDQYFTDGGILRHFLFLLLSCFQRNGRTGLRYPGDRRRLRDGTGR